MLIADVVGFADLTPAVSPERLALLLEEIFAVFDGLAKARGLRKIKTLGNSYMAAAGVPVAVRRPCGAGGAPGARHDRGAGPLQRAHEHALQVRIGIATGPVVAGVIGRRMYLYDVWGEAVNTASRMESHGVAGRVQVAESTRQLLGEPFLLEERGALEVEGKGDVKTWFLGGRRGRVDRAPRCAPDGGRAGCDSGTTEGGARSHGTNGRTTSCVRRCAPRSAPRSGRWRRPARPIALLQEARKRGRHPRTGKRRRKQTLRRPGGC